MLHATIPSIYHLPDSCVRERKQLSRPLEDVAAPNSCRWVVDCQLLLIRTVLLLQEQWPAYVYLTPDLLPVKIALHAFPQRVQVTCESFSVEGRAVLDFRHNSTGE